MIYKGSCHCGKVAFEVESDHRGGHATALSICSRKGSLLWFVPRMRNGTYHILDLVPKGRDEANLPFTMSWVRHHDRYGD